MSILVGGPQDAIKYTATAPDGSVATFNDPTDANYVGMAYFSGLDSPDIRESIDLRSGSDGGIQGLNFRGTRPVVGTVEIVATSTGDRNAKTQRLKRAMNALRADGTLAFTPDGGVASQVKYRLNGPVRRSDERGWKYTFQFPMMCADPYIYSQGLRTASVSASPWQATATNQGDGESAPAIHIDLGGSTVSVTVSNLTSGKSLILPSVNPNNFFGGLTLTFGSSGTGNGLFNYPWKPAVDGSGNVFVTDYSNHRVQKFNSSGVYQSQFGTFGTGNGQFNGPSAICFDGAGKIWVCDVGNNRIQRFSAAGAYETQFGSAGSGNGQFNGPNGICVDGAGNIFVVDSGNHRIQKLAAGTPPTYTSQFGSLGSGNNNFNNPNDIVADTGGTNLFICDTTNRRIKKVTNASPPVFVSHFGSAGTGNGQFYGPTSITRDSAGVMYVADTVLSRMQKFNSSGTYLAQASFSPGTSYGLGMLGSTTTPLYLAVLNQNNVQKWSTGAVSLDIDLATASILAAGANMYDLLDVPNSQWWSLLPGDNALQVIGGTAWSATWRDAWL